MPTSIQDQVDTLAFFVEAAAAAAREPFYRRETIPSFRGTWTAERAICSMGDRLHFRSALIHFHRLWNPHDEAHWRKTTEIVASMDLTPALKGRVRWGTELIDRELTKMSRPAGVGLTVAKCLELGMNAFYAPAAAGQKALRLEYEAKAREITATVLECMFRHDVYALGFQFINFSDNVVRPVLELAKSQFALVPAFEPGFLQRIKRREQTSDGRIIVREGTSERPHEEPFAARFARLLLRSENRELEQILKHLEVSPGDLQRSILRGEGFASLIKEIDGRIETQVFPKDRVGGLPRQDFLSAGNFDHLTRFCLYHGNFVLVQEGGVAAYDVLLERFRRQLIED